MSAAPLAELKDVSKRYAAVGRDDLPEVLHEVSLVIEPGDSIAIVGPSGSGKSTLLHLLGALSPPTSGSVSIDGQAIAGKSRDELAHLRSAKIGFVFQAHHLLPQCTVWENVLIPALAVKDRARRLAAEDRARSLLAEVGLAERHDHRPAQLSGGECQRVALVRALVLEPRLLLADEPTGSLDAQSAEGLADLLESLNRKKALTLVLVTHSEALAKRMARVYELRGGRLTLRPRGA